MTFGAKPRRNSTKFYIGIDPSTEPLEKISEKIYRNPAKGGAANVLFIQAAVEEQSGNRSPILSPAPSNAFLIFPQTIDTLSSPALC